jgi:hypothetical protein
MSQYVCANLGQNLGQTFIASVWCGALCWNERPLLEKAPPDAIDEKNSRRWLVWGKFSHVDRLPPLLPSSHH